MVQFKNQVLNIISSGRVLEALNFLDMISEFHVNAAFDPQKLFKYAFIDMFNL
jgi:hypothetical protein